MKPYIVYFFIKENRKEYLADVVIEAASAKEACARCKEWYFKKTGKNAFRPTTSICFACGDEVIGYDFVEQFILELQDKLGVVIVQVGYDRYNAISTVQKLEAAGIECVEVRQHSSVLHSPTKLLQEKILSRKFAYNENRMLEINFENARCTEDTNRNKYVNKKRSAGKVDMVVAIINGVYLQEQEDLYGMDFVIQT